MTHTPLANFKNNALYFSTLGIETPMYPQYAFLKTYWLFTRHVILRNVINIVLIHHNLINTVKRNYKQINLENQFRDWKRPTWKLKFWKQFDGTLWGKRSQRWKESHTLLIDEDWWRIFTLLYHSLHKTWKVKHFHKT